MPKKEEAGVGGDGFPVHDPGAFHPDQELLQVIEPAQASAPRRTLAHIGVNTLRVDILHRGISDGLEFPVLEASVICQFEHLRGAQWHGVCTAPHPEYPTGLIHRAPAGRDRRHHHPLVVQDVHLRLNSLQEQGRVNLPGSAQDHIARERHARVRHANHPEAAILHSNNDQPSLGVRHPAHAFGQLARSGHRFLEFHRARFATGDRTPQGCIRQRRHRRLSPLRIARHTPILLQSAQFS
jgi:hypothetical protein